MNIYKIENFLKFYDRHNGTEFFENDEKVKDKLKDEDGYTYNSYSTLSIVEDYKNAAMTLTNMIDDIIEKGLITNTRRGYKQTFLQKEISFLITAEQYNEGYADVLRDGIEAKLLEEANIKHIKTKVDNKGVVEHEGKKHDLHVENLCYVQFVYDVELKKDKLYNL